MSILDSIATTNTIDSFPLQTQEELDVAHVNSIADQPRTVPTTPVLMDEPNLNSAIATQAENITLDLQSHSNTLVAQAHIVPHIDDPFTNSNDVTAITIVHSDLDNSTPKRLKRSKAGAETSKPKTTKTIKTSKKPATKTPAKHERLRANSDKPQAQYKRLRKRTPRNYNSYGTFIYKVLKQVYPTGLGISKSAMSVMESFVFDLFERIAREAGTLARTNKRQTMTSREIQTATRLILPKELANHAIAEGAKAIMRFTDQKLVV